MKFKVYDKTEKSKPTCNCSDLADYYAKSLDIKKKLDIFKRQRKKSKYDAFTLSHKALMETKLKTSTEQCLFCGHFVYWARPNQWKVIKLDQS